MSDRTIDILRRILTEKPDDVETRLHLAELLRASGKKHDAISELRIAMKTHTTVEGLRPLIELLHETGQAAQAIAHLDRFLEMARDDASAHLLASRVFLAAGNPAAAEEQYEKAIEIDDELEDRSLLDDIQAPGAREPIPLGPVEESLSKFLPETTPLSFADVGGMETVKEALRMQIILPLQRPAIFASYGKKAGGGVLMYGPPGCGKTHLARATAGECRAKFYHLGLHDILDMWIGSSEKNLHQLFVDARRTAPSIIFLDELDALGHKRGELGAVAHRGVVNTLLVEMDKIHQDEVPILVIGATNTPWSLDTALKRPGRFDRVVFVPPPDPPARAEILGIHLKGRPARDVDVNAIARKLEKFSGADLRAVVDRASDEALRLAMKSGREVPLTTKMLLEAANQLRPSTVEWLATARDYAKYSNEAGLYDPVLEYLDR